MKLSVLRREADADNDSTGMARYATDLLFIVVMFR